MIVDRCTHTHTHIHTHTHTQELTKLYHTEHMLLFHTVSLSINHLTSLHGIGQLKSVRCLELDGNRLEELPEELAELTELRELSLKNNRILECLYIINIVEFSCYNSVQQILQRFS